MVPTCTMEPPGLARHGLGGQAAQLHGPDDVDLEGPAPRLPFALGDGRGLAAGGRHVDQDVDPAEPVQCLLHQRLARIAGRRSRTRRGATGPRAGGGQHLGRHRLQAGGVPGRHHDVGALPSEGRGARPPDAGPGAGHDRGHASERAHGWGSSTFRIRQSPRSGAHGTPLMWPPPSTKSVLPVR